MCIGCGRNAAACAAGRSTHLHAVESGRGGGFGGGGKEGKGRAKSAIAAW